MREKKLEISHYVGLSGVGGVQSNFVEYIKFNISKDSHLKHTVFTNGKVDSHYELPLDVNNIRNINNFILLIGNIVSKKKVVHFYNNLSSFKVALLLLVLPTSNLIFHERGSSWNLPSKYGFILKFISWKSTLIIANSFATKTLLVKKFCIKDEKIKVIHNGINKNALIGHKSAKKKKNNFFFNVGFIGRLDTPKGVHILIEAMQYLNNENIKLIIAGDGPLKNILMKQSGGLNNIEFIGRVKNPYEFFDRINLLVVPSIREPLGNVCLEAGVFKVPILASNIDGIPEIVRNYHNGELLSPDEPIILSLSSNSLPLPEYVIEPSKQELIKPMQINSKVLADRILFLSTAPKILSQYTDRMYDNVLKNFSISSYSKKLHRIYLEIARVK
jgi:glycosyltransferase involved in cell wall biosynthesis